MPKHSRLFVKPFIGGINTETSSVEDAILHTADELNCTILPEGIRGRRLGFNIERDGKWIEEEPSTSYSGYLWKNVNKTGRDIIVQQVNTTLYFFDSDAKPFTGSDERQLGTCDISLYSKNVTNNEIGALRYAIGDGLLYIVNDNIRPLRIIAESSDSGGFSFYAEEFTLYIRDLDGVDDYLDVDEMPTSSVTEEDMFGGLSNEHFYNLLNQGWNDDDILQFEQDKDKWPSNNLQWFIGKDDSGNYNTEKMLNTYFGNTPAPKGHFIIDYFKENRSEVSGIYGLSPFTASYKYANWWIKNRKLRADAVKEFNMDFSTPGSSVVRDYFETKENGETLKAVVIKFSQIERKSDKKAHDGFWHGNIRFVVYGCNTVEEVDMRGRNRQRFKKSNIKHYLEDYEEIHNEIITTYGASAKDPFVVRLQINNDNAYKYYRIAVVFGEGSNTAPDIPYPIAVECRANLYMEGQDDSIFEDTYKADTITDITYMPGRLFYLVNDTVLFSQVIRNNGTGFESCHQESDPTSEEISDILPTDGGYVKFNNIGVGRALESFNRGVLVFGDNIVYGLISPLEKAFSASDYDILELSRAGIIGDKSVVSTDDMVYYWSPMGIFRIGINPNTGSSIIAECITHETIQEYYDRIPNEAKKTCRGCFDYVNNRIYWYYAEGDESHKLNRCLVLDLSKGAFMPFKIEGDEFITDAFNSKVAYEINPTMYLRAGGDRVVADGGPVIADEEVETFKRWTAIQHTICNDEGYFSFGDYNSREFKDFDKAGYDSYMVSRPIMFEGFSTFGNPINSTATDKQVPVLQTLFKRTEQNVLQSLSKVASKISKYDLKEYRYYTSDWKAYTTAVEGSLKYFMYAQTAVLNTGKLHSADIVVDLSSFIGENVNVGVEILSDNGSIFKEHRQYTNLQKLTDTFTVIGDEEVVHKGFNIEVTVVNDTETYSGKYLGIRGTFNILRTNNSENTFVGFRKETLKGSLTLNKQFASFDYKGSTKITPCFITSGKFTLESSEDFAPTTLQAKADSMNFFYTPASYQPIGYSVITKDKPTVESWPQSISNDITLKRTLDLTTSRVGGRMLYEIDVVIPEYKNEEKLFTRHINYIGASGAYIRMRWGWSLDDRSNRWDMVQNGYRPQKDFLHDEYVESKIHVRGRGKAFQIEIRNDDNKDFRLAGMNVLVRSR